MKRDDIHDSNKNVWIQLNLCNIQSLTICMIYKVALTSTDEINDTWQ